MRCTTPSAFCHATVSGAPGETGLGLNDWLPRSPAMLTVTDAPGGGVGDGPVLEPPPPQAAAASTHPNIPTRTNSFRITCLPLCDRVEQE
jgi:hypothetical protein